MQVAQQVAIRLGRSVVRRNHLARDDQHVDRRLGIDITEGQAAIIFVDNVGGNLLVEDLLEEVVLHHGRTS